VLHLVYESTAHNKQLQRTVMHKVPRPERQDAAAELRRCAHIRRWRTIGDRAYNRFA